MGGAAARQKEGAGGRQEGFLPARWGADVAPPCGRRSGHHPAVVSGLGAVPVPLLRWHCGAVGRGALGGGLKGGSQSLDLVGMHCGESRSGTALG